MSGLVNWGFVEERSRVPENTETSRKPVVLIADDDRELCEILSYWLRERFELLVAFDGDDALTAAHRCAPDAALIDVMMPRLSGLGLIWAFTHHPRLKGLPVAVMTAYPDATVPAAGMFPTLVKPFNRDDVERVVSELVARRFVPPVPPMSQQSSHRRTERLAVSFPASLERAELSFRGALQSLSLLGGFFKSELALPIASRWTLKFQRASERFELPVEVIHNLQHGGETGVGLRFYELGLDGEQRIQKLLEELLS